jgi:hypothetical protein
MLVALIRDMDAALVAGAGGYSTREEFIAEAVRDKLLELAYEPAPPGPGEPANAPAVLIPMTGGRDDTGDRAPPIVMAPTFDLSETVLRAPASGFSMAGEAVVQDRPLLGLHNRDYTSIWALSQLAELLRESPQPLAATLSEVTERAWEFAGRVRPHDAGAELKLTALFPTNRAKAQSASGQFRAFAIGTVRESAGRLHGDGPLFVWGALQARHVPNNVEVGLTATGWELLAAVDGISLRLPHAPELAGRYLAYLRQHAPADFAGLVFALRGAAERMARAELIASYQESYPTWTEAQASTNAAGYVARGREWGLIEPKLVERRYRPTSTCEQILADLT